MWLREDRVCLAFKSISQQQQREQQPPLPLRALAFIYSLKCPQNSKHKLSSAGRITPLPKHKTNHSQQCGLSEAAPYLTAGIKRKTYSHNITGFFKKPKFSLQRPSSQGNKQSPVGTGSCAGQPTQLSPHFAEEYSIFARLVASK